MTRMPLELQPTLFAPSFGEGKRTCELPCGCLRDNLTGATIVSCEAHPKKGRKAGNDSPSLPLVVPPDPEKELRAMWDKKGISKERQDEIIKDVEEKAAPGYMDKFFKKGGEI